VPKLLFLNFPFLDFTHLFLRVPVISLKDTFFL